MHNHSHLLQDITLLVKVLTPMQWDRFVLWLIGSDGPLANVRPRPSCLVIVEQLYRGRLDGRPHEPAVWADANRCLFDVAIGERYSECCDQKSRRRKVSGRLAASAGANAAFVYAALPYNPQRYSSPARLVMHKVQAISDACAAMGWTVAPARYPHKRHDSTQIGLEECKTELEALYTVESAGVAGEHIHRRN